MAHGCQAGLQQEACDKVYFARILRGKEHYTWQKLGAFGSDLGAIACFFETPVEPPLARSHGSRPSLAAERSRQLPTRLGPADRVPRADAGDDGNQRRGRSQWKNAAVCASNLSELELTLGEVAGAMGDAEQSVTYADRSGDAAQRYI